MRAPDHPAHLDRLVLALALGTVGGLTGCVLEARLGALDGGDGEASSDAGETNDAGSLGADDADVDVDADADAGPDGANEIPPGLEPVANTGVVIDCDYDAGYEVSSWRASDPSSPRLWVGGVYETRSDHGGGFHPTGAGTVTWGEPGRNVLVLGSYEPTDWTITLAAGGVLERVIATGYHPQTVQAPAGVAVEIHSLEEGAATWACGFALPGEGEGCEGEELVGFATWITGLDLFAFDGCYRATAFEYLP